MLHGGTEVTKSHKMLVP